MDLFYDDLLINATEFVKDRFFFISIRTEEKPKSTTCTHYFSIDSELVYESFFNDFGPLNISMLYHYCVKLNKKLKSPALQRKRIVHYTTFNDQKRVNAAYLACSYAIIYLNYTPERVNELLAVNNSETYIDFRDASIGLPYTISLSDCLSAVYKAHKLGFFNFDDFDFLEYEHYERVENGDLNWIIPGKFIGFCGPHNRSRIANGYPLHSPETYFSYFRRHNVTTIIRLNKKMYEASKFTRAGFVHKDLYFIDGSTPSDRIVNQFISICEKTDGAVAVHCKAGLGRTGSLIGCYIMKHYKFTARETIAWVRMCRPGSVIGHQQNWLESKQTQLWKAGDEYCAKMGIDELLTHSKGIYSYNHVPELSAISKRSPKKNDVSGILQKVDTMQLEDKDAEDDAATEPMTQGDRLNQIKAQRRQRATRQLATNEKKVFRGRVLVSPIDAPSMLRGGKVIGLGIKNSGASTSRTLTKREYLPTIEEAPEESSMSHVVFLYPRFLQEYQDLYLIDVADALERFGHKVTVFTSCFEHKSVVDPLHLRIQFSGWWLPNSICDTLKDTMVRIKLAWMTWRLIICPPKLKPDVIILDTDSVALFVLYWFSNYKTICIHRFLQRRYNFSPCSISAKAIGYADEVVVQSKWLRNVFKKSFSKIRIEPCVLYPCISTRSWTEVATDVRSLLPDLPTEYILFVAFGDYTEHGNFKLVLDAFDQMLSSMESPIKEKVHVAVAGHGDETSLEQIFHRTNFINATKQKSHSKQVTFLKQLSTVQKKTLIEKCTAVIHLLKDDVYSETILTAMCLGRPIIAVNMGFANEVLNDGFTGILLEPESHKFAAAMFKAATNPVLRMFIGGRAREAFRLYSFENFSKKLNDLLMKHVNVEC